MTVTCSVTSLLLTLDDYLSPLPFVTGPLFSHMDSFFRDCYWQHHITLFTLNAYLYPFSFVLVSFSRLGLLLTVFCHSSDPGILHLSCLIRSFTRFARPTFVRSHDYYRFLFSLSTHHNYSLVQRRYLLILPMILFDSLLYYTLI